VSGQWRPNRYHHAPFGPAGLRQGRILSMKTRIAFALLAAVLALAAAGCGKNIDRPESGDDAVARVDDEKITKAEFDHWLATAARGQQPPGGGEAVVPDPPSFTKCVEAKGRAPAQPGAPKPDPVQLKDQCRQEFEGLRDQVMQFLVSAEWIRQEADTRGIEVSDQEVRQQFEDQKKQSFQKDRDYEEFLRTSGQTENDLLFRVEVDLLSNQIREDVIKGQGEISQGEIEDYYNENKERFGQPELRDIRVVKTDDEADADEAHQALEDGDKFSAVAKKYSTDETSKSQGGELAAVQKGQQLLPKAAEDAVFSARKGELMGPVETDQGFYVFEVTKITPASQQTLEEARETIANLLRSQKEQETLDGFIEDFRREYRGETICADGYTFSECDNFKSESDTGPAYGGEPKGGPPVGKPEEAPAAPPQLPGLPGVPGAPPGAGGGAPPGAGGGAPPGAGGGAAPPPQPAP
jgi:foldase protein PrsA